MTQPFEEAEVPDDAQDTLALRLFIAGASANSSRAIVNLKNICETHLAGHYVLEVIDVHQQPELAQQEQLLALPVLVIQEPKRRLIGDMSDVQKVLKGLGLAT